MALQSCYECNKEISTKALMCPQCGAPQNPVSGLTDKVKEKSGFFFKKVKNHLEEARNRREIERKIEHLEEFVSSHPKHNWLLDEQFGKFSGVYIPGIGNEGIQELMEEMEIDIGIDSNQIFDWEWQIHSKINEIRERRKEESKTIHSRFRPKE